MAPPPHPRSRILLRILLAVVLLLVGGVAAGELAGWSFLRAPLERFASRHLQRPVRIAAPFRLHLLGAIDVHAGALWIGAPAGFDAPHLIDARDVDLRLRYRDLLGRRDTEPLRIEGLRVANIDARLIRDARGDATWRFGPSKKEGEAAPPPRLAHLTVGTGEALIDDAPTDTRLTVKFSTEEGAAEREPSAHARIDGRLRGRPLSGKLVTRGLIPLAEREAAAPVPVRGDIEYGGVHLAFDGGVSELWGARDLKASASARGPSLSVLGKLFGLVLPTTDPFALHGKLSKEGGLWHIDVDSATIGDSALRGRFVYNKDTTPPRLDGELGGERLVLADLAPAFGTRTPDGERAPPPAGRVLPHRKLNLPELKNMDANVAVNVDHVDLGKLFSQPIAPLKGHLRLEGKRLALRDIDATTAKGRLRGEIAIDARPQPAQWRSELQWSGIHLQDWFGGPGKGRDETYLSGTLHGRSKLTGQGNAVDEVLGSLDGDVTLFIRQGRVSHLVIELLGLDVAQSLGLVLTGNESVKVSCAAADLEAKNGRLTPRVALLDTPVTLVLADGSVDLGRERLDLRLTAKPKNVSPFTLRSPILVQGSFDDPRFVPKSGPLAAKVLASLALGILNPLAAILPFVDLGEAVGPQCREALAELKH